MVASGPEAITMGTTSFEFLREFASSDGVGNSRCDGSSSENECNGKFDLNHVE